MWQALGRRGREHDTKETDGENHKPARSSFEYGCLNLAWDAAISVAPMAGCGCFHKSREVERKKEAETEVL